MYQDGDAGQALSLIEIAMHLLIRINDKGSFSIKVKTACYKIG